MVQLKADCSLYFDRGKGRVHPDADVEQTLAGLFAKYGPRPRVAVLPLGPLAIPYVK